MLLIYVHTVNLCVLIWRYVCTDKGTYLYILDCANIQIQISGKTD